MSNKNINERQYFFFYFLLICNKKFIYLVLIWSVSVLSLQYNFDWV